MCIVCSTLIGIVVPDHEVLLEWSKAQGRTDAYVTLCRDPAVKKLILEDMIATGKAQKLHSFEQVKDVHIEPEAFSVENGLLTPTFKCKREECKKKYAAELQALYAKVEPN